MNRKLIHLVSNLGLGGVERWLLDLTPSLIAAGWQVTFIEKGGASGVLAGPARAMGASVVHCPLTRHPLRYLTAIRREASVPDTVVVVNSHLQDQTILATLALAGLGRRVSLVNSFHNTRMVNAASPWPLNHHAVRRLLLALPLRIGMWSSDVITGCSAAVVDALPRTSRPKVVLRLSAPPATGEPLDRRHLGIESEEVFLSVAVGRLEPQKNFSFLLEAFARVVRSQPASVLVIIGDGTQRARLEEQAHHLGVLEHVRFLGRREDVRAILAAGDLLVLTSEHEGFGLVVVEAAVEGTHSLLVRVPGLDEAGAACGATLVEPGSVQRFADEWLRLMRLPTGELEACGDQSRSLAAENLSHEHQVETYLSALDLAQRHRRGDV